MENPENVRIPERLREIAFWLRADEAWNEANWIDAAADEIEHLRSLATWRSIETAPKDGTEILLWDGGVIELCYWKTGRGWVVSWNDDLFRIREYEKEDASHWLPLPTPPEADT